MPTENSKAREHFSAALTTHPKSSDVVGAGGVYTVTCTGPDGKVKWTDTFHNLVTNVGLKSMNDVYFGAATQIATWYMGLVTGPGSGTTYAAADTLASHAGWTENTDYAGNRKAVTFGAATTANPSVVTNTPTAFAINGTATIAGAFLCSVATTTTGTLFSGGDFTGGDKSVADGDALNCTYAFSLTAA